ncbi:AMP-binding protein [Phenylobacterium sp.]|uniref:AMP-binding protein n=1 Tax=Phenylobacterium sp. TaxID=1871053 RepID=UPI002FCA8658
MPTAPALHPFIGRDAPWLVDAQARARPDARFLAWEPLDRAPRTWTYAEFAHETRRFARGLAARGVGEGDLVILHMANCPEFMFLWFACARVGAVVVTTNTRSTEEEMAYFIEHSSPKAAVTQSAFAAMVDRAAKGRLAWIACADDGGSDERPADQLDLAALPLDEGALPDRRIDPMAANSIQYTSGTTARPKGVVWTHANALWGAKTTAAHLHLTPRDATPVFLPLFHTNALVYSTLSTLWSGGTVVLMPRFSASRFWEIVVRNGCTWSSMVRFPAQALLDGESPDKHPLRFVGLGAGDVSAIRDRWGARALGWFGMTETVGQCAMSDLEFPGPPGSMGRVSAHYEVAIRADDGRDVAPGEIGGLWIRGTPGLTMFQGYLNDPGATAAAFDADGWFETGDLAKVDADGHLFYVGRAKDMLKVGGENVAALEIESVVLRARGVREAAVVGRPDRMRDEVPVAFVVAETPGPEIEAEILRCCEEGLSDFKRPREIIFVDDLPKGLLDKVLKRELRDRLLA